jgi:hypothetical protein
VTSASHELLRVVPAGRSNSTVNGAAAVLLFVTLTLTWWPVPQSPADVKVAVKVPAALAGAAGSAATKVTSRPARAASATATRVRGATRAVSWSGASDLCPAAAR